MSGQTQDRYAEFLAASGVRVCNVDGVWWFRYNGFLRPAYLPHTVPAISQANASMARKELGGMFARWDRELGAVSDTLWWYVVRSGSYSMDQISGNTRSKIRRGLKRLQSRRVSVDEIREQGLQVCRRAVSRYGKKYFLPQENDFHNKLDAAESYSDCCEFFGVFRGNQMVGFSENHVQDDAVFWESIWYDPDALRDYSSYVLSHTMLDYYLNDQAFLFVSDGCRSLYHETDIQAFLIGKFGFEKRYASLSVEYSAIVGALVRTIFPLRRVFEKVSTMGDFDSIARIRGLILQESIARACQSKAGQGDGA